MIICGNKEFHQVANEVLESLISQGAACMDDDGCCRYGYGCLNCAIGKLLPPDREDLMDFNSGLQKLVERFKDLGPNDAWLRNNFKKLRLLQGFHDAALHGDKLENLGVSAKLLTEFNKIAPDR